MKLVSSASHLLGSIESRGVPAVGCTWRFASHAVCWNRLLRTINGNTRLFLTTNSMIKAMGEIQGYNAVIEKAGGVIMKDSCCLELALDPNKVFATNSGKLGHYAPGAIGLKNTWFGTLEECIDAALTGKWRGELK